MKKLLLLLVLILCSAVVSAHIVPFSETYVEHDGNEINFRMEAPVWLNMSNPAAYNYTFDYFYGGFLVLNDGEPCEIKDLKISYDDELDYSYYNFSYSCNSEINDVDIANLLFYDIFGYYFEQYLLFDCGDDDFKYMYSDMENVTNSFNAKIVCDIFTEKDEMAKRIFTNNTYKEDKEEIPLPVVETEVYGPELPPENLPTGFIAASPATKEKEMSFFNKIVGGVKAGEISILLLILFSFMFGVMHSFSPGHGKSVIVSYLLGKDAKIKDVATLSATTALTHISDVFIISLAFMFLIPKSLKVNFTGYINAGAAVLIFLFGVYLVAKNYKKYKHFLQHRLGHSHHHHHHHDHDHHHHPTSRKELFLAGVITGLAPCPTAWAIFLLLVGLGLYLKAFISVMAFSLGLVLTIMTIGTIFIKAKGLIKFIPEETKLAAHLPMLSSVLIVVIGIVLTVKNFILPYF